MTNKPPQSQKENFEHEFLCINCHKKVSLTEYGTKHRNHCPYCLWSKHVDETIGDRRSQCGGQMKPIGLSQKKDGETMVVHECTKCKKISANRIAGDDMPDKILEVFVMSEKIKITNNNLIPITDRDEVCTQLFGKGRY